MKLRKMLIPLLGLLVVFAACDEFPVRQPLAPEASLEFHQDAIQDAEPALAKAGNMVPFKGKGTWQAVEFIFPDPDVMEMEIVVEFEGTATHLGRFQAVWTGRYIFILVDDAPVPTEYLSHSDMYTAANGDKLYGVGSVDEGTEHFPDDDGIGFLLTGIDIVGGTGRFEGAEGCYELLTIATVGFPFPGGTWELEGEISRPGR